MTLPPHEIRTLSTRRLGAKLWHFPLLDSTNELALSLAGQHDLDGLAIMADEQSAGRGQYGRTWTSPPRSSVLLSLLLFPPGNLRRPALLTAWAAVAVCETILNVADLQAKIKWPNDVLVAGKKVCGILIEQRNTGRPERPLACAVGIGLNVNQPASFFQGANLPAASSLSVQADHVFETSAVAERLIHQLDAGYAALLEGETGTLESLWKWRLGLLGRQVELELTQGTRQGRLVDVALDGVILEDGDEIMQFAPEAVRHIAEVNS